MSTKYSTTANSTDGQTTLNIVADNIRDVHCVETAEVVPSHYDGNDDDYKIIATVKDDLSRRDLKAKLSDIITPVYVDIRIENEDT